MLDGTSQSHVVLRGLTIMHSNGSATGEQGFGLVMVGDTDWLIENCTISYGDFGGLGMHGDHHTIRRCRIEYNGNVGIGMNGSDDAHKWGRYDTREPEDTTFDDLDVSHNNYRHFYEDWAAGGFKLIPAIRGVTVSNCRVVENAGHGIWIDGGLGNNRIVNNLVVKNLRDLL